MLEKRAKQCRWIYAWAVAKNRILRGVVSDMVAVITVRMNLIDKKENKIRNSRGLVSNRPGLAFTLNEEANAKYPMQ